jgi:hypothetical protein
LWAQEPIISQIKENRDRMAVHEKYGKRITPYKKYTERITLYGTLALSDRSNRVGNIELRDLVCNTFFEIIRV